MGLGAGSVANLGRSMNGEGFWHDKSVLVTGAGGFVG